MRANADLDGAFSRDQALFLRMKKHGAVIYAAGCIFPRIGMGIEVDEGQSPVFCCVRFQ